MLFDHSFRCCQIGAVEHNQHAADRCATGIGIGVAGRIGRTYPAIKPGPVKGEVGIILLKLPAKGCGEKGTRRRKVRRGELDIIDFL